MEWFKKREILDPFTGELYLTRRILVKSRWLSIYLHEFHIPDGERSLHNHPWTFALSLILTGSYVEQRMGRGPKLMRFFNFLTANTYHRVSSLNGTVRTIFIGGPRTQDWGFMVKGRHVPHEDYFRQVKAGNLKKAGK